jgi:type I restriction enzyme S subunit
MECKLGDIIDIKHGYAFKGEFFSDEQTDNILVTPGNFQIGGGFKSDKLKFYGGVVPHDYILQTNDVIVTMTDLSKEADTLGYSAVVPEITGKRFLHNQRIGLITCKSNSVNIMFINWLLRTEEYRWHIIGSASGSTVSHTSPSRILEYKFLLPPLSEQCAIAHMLSSLDDKIDVLQRQNNTLEAMAAALWRKMFVEEAGSNLKKAKLGDIAEINPLRSTKKETITLYLDMSNMPTNGPFPVAWIQREFTSGMKFKNGDTIIARITPCLENGKTAYVNFLDDKEIGWGSTEYIVLSPKSRYCPEWFYFLARSEDFRDYAIQNMTGTSGRQRVSGESIAQYEIMIPPLKDSEQFGEFAGPIMEHIKHNSFEIRTLSKLRDTLLSKLMTGEVVVRL